MNHQTRWWILRVAIAVAGADARVIVETPAPELHHERASVMPVRREGQQHGQRSGRLVQLVVQRVEPHGNRFLGILPVQVYDGGAVAEALHRVQPGRREPGAQDPLRGEGEEWLLGVSAAIGQVLRPRPQPRRRAWTPRLE